LRTEWNRILKEDVPDDEIHPECIGKKWTKEVGMHVVKAELLSVIREVMNEEVADTPIARAAYTRKLHTARDKVRIYQEFYNVLKEITK